MPLSISVDDPLRCNDSEMTDGGNHLAFGIIMVEDCLMTMPVMVKTKAFNNYKAAYYASESPFLKGSILNFEPSCTNLKDLLENL